MNEWIPVTERLPVENDRYLTVSIEPWFGTTVYCPNCGAKMDGGQDDA